MPRLRPWSLLLVCAFVGCSDGAQQAPGYGDTDGVSCTPGDTRCHGDLGFQSCSPDGTWGESRTCAGYSENGTSSYCALVTSGEQRWAACVDPACWWWSKSGLAVDGGRVGVCASGDTIRACEESGVLSASESCNGVCHEVGAIDGRALGYCEAACQDGDRECVAGPLFHSCLAGRWSEVVACDGGEACQPLATGAHSDVKCGGSCGPNTSRCSAGESAVEVCNADGSWQSSGACALGRCLQSGAQAQCQTECKPGERACAFDGDTVSRTCSEAGLWLDPSACEGEARCRIGTSGALGCLECIGSNTAGGNAWGTVDRRCEASAVSACGADDTYAAPVPCPTGTQCVEQRRAGASVAYCQ